MREDKLKGLLSKLISQDYAPVQAWNFRDAYVIEALKKGNKFSELFKIDKRTGELYDFNPTREQIRILQRNKSTFLFMNRDDEIIESLERQCPDYELSRCYIRRELNKEKNRTIVRRLLNFVTGKNK